MLSKIENKASSVTHKLESIFSKLKNKASPITYLLESQAQPI